VIVTLTTLYVVGDGADEPGEDPGPRLADQALLLQEGTFKQSLPVCLSVCLSACLSVYRSLYLSVCLPGEDPGPRLADQALLLQEGKLPIHPVVFD
jgi:hypothetical protein